MKKLLCMLAVTALLFTGCATTVKNADGTVSVTEADYMGIQLMASASIAAWAAASKNGLSKNDVETVVRVLTIIEEFHADGEYIDVSVWTAEVQKQFIQPRYQSLAIVMVQLISYELERYGVATTVPTPTNIPGKILKAIRTGVMVALAPYVAAKA